MLTESKINGYIQFGSADDLPMYCVKCKVKHIKLDDYEIYFEGKWRKIKLHNERQGTIKYMYKLRRVIIDYVN